MKQLTMQDLYDLCVKMEVAGLDLKKIQVYLGDDDELNGIHCAWFCEMISKNNKNEDMQYILDMINERGGNIELKDKGVLIS